MTTTTVLSPYSNRLVNAEDPVKPPIFWCGICKLKLNTPPQAVQHLTGHSHKAKVSTNIENIKINTKNANVPTRKRGLGWNSDTSLQKTNVYDEVPNKLYCSDCDVTLNSLKTSKLHFDGKKHAMVVASKTTWPLSSGEEHTEKQSPTQNLPPPPKKKKEQGVKGFCDDCNIVLNSDEQGIQHYNGMKHKLNAGIISTPPDRWLANQKKGRGRGGEAGVLRGEQRSTIREQTGDCQREELFISEHNSFAYLHGGSHKIDWSIRGRGLMRGVPHNIIANSNKVIRGVSPRSKGRVGARQMKRGLRASSKVGRGTTEVGGGVVAASSKNNIINEPATVPGGRNSLSNYFVGANSTNNNFLPHTPKVKCDSNSNLSNSEFIPKLTPQGESHAISSSHDIYTNPKEIPQKVKSHVNKSLSHDNFKPTPVTKPDAPVQKDLIRVSSTYTTTSKDIKKDEKCIKATVPGAKGTLKGSFVNASKSDHFKIEVDKKATVPGGKGSLNDFFVAKGTKDHFKPEGLIPISFNKPKIKHTNKLDEYHGRPYDYVVSPGSDFESRYQSGYIDYPSPKNYYSNEPQSSREKFFASPVPQSPESGGGNYYSYGRNGYLTPNYRSEYQVADVTYDSYYA